MARRAGMLLLLFLALGPRLRAAAENDALSSPEPERPTEQARLHFQLGVDFYREGNFRAALIEFQRAYHDAPHYKLLFNLGEASLELQEYTNAIEYLTKYLREGGSDITDQRRAEVEETIHQLEKRIASVTVTVDQDGVEILVDDTLLGHSPLTSPARVSAGRRTFSAVKPGFPSVKRTLDLAAGDQVTLRLELEEHPVAKAVPALAVPSETAPAISPQAWAALTTSILGASAITLSVLTATAQKSYDNERDRITTKATLDDLRSDARARAMAADVLWGATLISAVVTTVLIATKRRAKLANTESPRVGLEPGLRGLGVNVHF